MKSLLESIGNTPLVRLARLPGPGSADVFVKLEGANPTGSMKDRMALSMVEGAERRGDIKAGGTVVDYTGGSTGSSLAMVCAAKGYKARFVSSDAFAEEKLQTMRAFGATVEIIPSVNRKVTPELIQKMVARARELASQRNSSGPTSSTTPTTGPATIRWRARSSRGSTAGSTPSSWRSGRAAPSRGTPRC